MLVACLVVWLVASVDWLVGTLVGWLDSRWVVGLLGWSVGWKVGWLVGGLLGSLVDCYLGRLVGCLVAWMVGWVVWLLGSLVD